MAEDNTQDMAMEDILSSIKNILEQDEALQSFAEPVAELVTEVKETVVEVPAEVEPIFDEQAEVNIDDILDLSPDMQVEEPVLEALPEPQEINLDAELDRVEPSAFEEAVSFEIADDKEEVVLDHNAESGVKLGWEDFESDPFDSQERTPSADEIIQDVAVEEEKPQVFFEPEPELEPVVETFEPEPEVIAEPVAEPAFEPVVEVYEPEPEPVKEEQPVATADDATDISANIISNFTKMFAHAEIKAAVTEPAAASFSAVNLVGDGTKTIEEVVAQVIKNIIGAEVAQNWHTGADYDTFAKQVISEQANAWLDENLPKIVESIVKKEIERVMAKVGNNQ